MLREKFYLPDAVGQIARARNDLIDHYSDSGLKFTPDGKLVGDLGEAVAAQMFDIDIVQQNYIDGYARHDRRPVQIKATGRANGSFLFRPCAYESASEIHLIALIFCWDECTFSVAYNDREELVRPKYLEGQSGQKSLTVSSLLKRSGVAINPLPANQDFIAKYRKI
ncbi:DUF6998 domain-containing protein [Qipengyuania marisflavi]|uniref:DUF6998 domain-containing protein n=1 Tax=Qipengyuania marisflavi TaxID=2486356 RepID=A0A5S3PDS3_9SPHN|nr:hypothetical protein [Qipengyuania marisflavi]TMM49700.1 hypothetical protein FEV51_00370 [Qipengyuania marisflavi]